MSTATLKDPATRILARPEHNLSRKNISSAALKVLYRLHRSGYLAYLVGGGVRDLLLGRSPKDFDIATNARPNEVRRLFRNSRVIGRRFRLVHVLFRGEIVEVATFRASPEAPEGPDDWREAEEEAAEREAAGEHRDSHAASELFGTPQEDAFRRDFTVNALFYNIADFSVIDYTGGLEDLEARTIRTLGLPEKRFEEDPVRMMRALEYAVRLGFDVVPESLEAIEVCRSLIRDASSARLTYELLESLRSGSAADICAAWSSSGLYQSAFPDLPYGADETPALLAEIDRRVKAGDGLSDAALIGAFFVPTFRRIVSRMRADGARLDRARLLDQLRAMLDPAGTSMHLPNHMLHLIHQGLFAFTKLERPPERGRQVLKLARQEYFTVACDLCSIAAAVGWMPADALRAWQRARSRVRQGASVDELVPGDARPRRPRRRRRRGRGRKAR